MQCIRGEDERGITMNDNEKVDVVICFTRGSMPKDTYDQGKAMFKTVARKCDATAEQTVYTLDGKTYIETAFEDVEGSVLYAAWLHDKLGIQPELVTKGGSQ